MSAHDQSSLICATRARLARILREASEADTDARARIERALPYASLEESDRLDAHLAENRRATVDAAEALRLHRSLHGC